jgi:hypothetical protein
MTLHADCCAIYVRSTVFKEPLINSESFSCAGKMPERRTVQIKAPIAGNNKAIAKIGNAELAHFNKQMLIHELIRGSLD